MAVGATGGGRVTVALKALDSKNVWIEDLYPLMKDYSFLTLIPISSIPWTPRSKLVSLKLDLYCEVRCS